MGSGTFEEIEVLGASVRKVIGLEGVVNYRRSTRPLRSSLQRKRASRRIDNAEFVRGGRKLDGLWFSQAASSSRPTGLG